jgi:bifunctional lysine-specific demethylase and histidyl-hydroxylase NO66
VRPSPLRDDPWTDHRAAVEEAATEPPLLEETLRPGDCLYLPRGYLHAASALGDVSTHLTIGVHPWTRRHLADEMVARAVAAASEDDRVRASLALGVDVADPSDWESDVDVVREAMVRALRDVPVETLAAALAARSRGTQRAAPVGPVATVRAAASLDGADVLRLRPRLQARLDGNVLRSRAGDIPLDADEASAIRALLGGEGTTAGDLGVDLARRLMLHGVVLVDEPLSLDEGATDMPSHP